MIIKPLIEETFRRTKMFCISDMKVRKIKTREERSDGG